MPKISELPLANKLKEEDYIPIVQDGVTKKVKGTHFVTEEEYSLDAFSPTIVANDKAMYKFGEGDNVDFSESAYDGAYKSAILKGNTLVNLNTNKQKQVTITSDVDYRTNFPYSIKSGTKITIKMSLSDNSLTQELMLEKKYTDGISGFQNLTPSIIDGRINITFHEQKDISTVNFYLQGSETGSITIKDVVILEGDYTNVDIPYFEGMKSVKMPVLKSIGKNLFDINLINEELGLNSYIDENNKLVLTGGEATKIKLMQGKFKEKTSYTLSYNFENVDTDVNRYRLQFKYTDGTVEMPPKSIKGDGSVILTTNNKKTIDYLWCTWGTDSLQPTTFSRIQLEEGSAATSFEPHKSNILSTPSDLELGGIGDVQDTLNLMTGEMTQRIESFILDGINHKLTKTAYEAGRRRFDTDITNLKIIGNEWVKTELVATSDKLIPCDFYTAVKTMSPCLIAWKNMLAITLEDESIDTVDKANNYLQNNPIEIQYVLDTPVHKTVDLSGTPFGYKGGHIIKSSAEGSLLPKFEYEVAVSRGAQISQNTSTLIKHDEKITELLKKTAATYINQKAEIAHLLNMSNTLEEVQTIPFIEDDYVNDDCMVDSDMVMDDMELEPEKEIIDNVDTLLINLIYDLIELNDTLDLSEKVELFRQSGLIDKHNYEIIKEKLNPSFKEEDYADINQ